MDQYFSAIIICLMTGIFSVITLVIQKKQDKVINKIDEQTMFIEKEKGLRQQITEKEKERDALIHEIMILILDTNLHILKNTQIAGAIIDDNLLGISEELKKEYSEITETIKAINAQYEVVLDMTSHFQKEIEKVRTEK